MTRFSLFVLAAATLLTPLAASAQTQQPASASTGGAPSVVNRTGAPVDVDKIIRTFAAREAEFRKALNEYSFKRDVVLQTIAMGGQISGEYRRVSRFVFDDSGNRFEKILFFPMPTTQLTITPEDLEDLGGVQAFALENGKLHEYDFSYVGKEKIDDLDLYVFDVSPKILNDERRLKELKRSKKIERFFQGRIWVDDQDFQIVKARGKGVPEFDQRYPTFETYREMIDGKYWFPTYTFADDELNFKSGQSIRLRLRVKFEEFERLRGKVRVVEEGEPGVLDKGVKDPEAKPTPTPPKPKP
ncbi:MAG TPA: hypothetical protein VE360_10990 [Pyrinomonadaceae bacterium]|nr:hypothetical protein [Pyrinomonadaceae bacterium]